MGKFWETVIDLDNLLERCSDKIRTAIDEQDIRTLTMHLYKGSDSEYAFWSMCVTYSDRLIAIVNHGRLVILEYIHNHKYDKSKFLRIPGATARYLQDNNLDKPQAKVSTSDSAIASLKVETRKQLLLAIKESKGVIGKRGELVQFSPTQQELLAADYPFLLRGHAGVGKSLLLLSHIIKAEDANPEELILYVSGQANIVAEMKETYKASVETPKENTKFFTYEQLLTHLFNFRPEQFVDEKHFIKWFKKYHKMKPVPNVDVPAAAAAKKSSSESLSDDQLLIYWEEIQIAAVYGSEDYISKLGENHSYYAKNSRMREYIYEVSVAYKFYLKGENLIAPRLFIPEALPFKCGLVGCDETQNNSLAQLMVLMMLANENKAAFVLGEQQNLINSRSNVFFIREFYFKNGINLVEDSLPVSHRCPRLVVDLANEFGRLNRNITGGTAYKGEKTTMLAAGGAAEGATHWWTKTELYDNLDLLRAKVSNQARFAVITLEKYFPKVRELLPRVQVYTVLQAQGLGLKDLIAYNIFDDEQLCRELVEASQLDQDKWHCAKRDEENLSQRRRLNEIITIITRTEDRITIIQDYDDYAKRRWQKAFKEILSLLFTQNSEKIDDIKASSKDEWLDTVQELIQNDLLPQAEEVWRLHLQDIFPDFPALQANIQAGGLVLIPAGVEVDPNLPHMEALTPGSPAEALPKPTPREINAKTLGEQLEDPGGIVLLKLHHNNTKTIFEMIMINKEYQKEFAKALKAWTKKYYGKEMDYENAVIVWLSQELCRTEALIKILPSLIKKINYEDLSLTGKVPGKYSAFASLYRLPMRYIERIHDKVGKYPEASILLNKIPRYSKKIEAGLDILEEDFANIVINICRVILITGLHKLVSKLYEDTRNDVTYAQEVLIIWVDKHFGKRLSAIDATFICLAQFPEGIKLLNTEYLYLQVSVGAMLLCGLDSGKHPSAYELLQRNSNQTFLKKFLQKHPDLALPEPKSSPGALTTVGIFASTQNNTGAQAEDEKADSEQLEYERPEMLTEIDHFCHIL